MGYRSEVVITIKKELFEAEGNILKEYLQDCDSITLRDEAYYFKWTGVKWYDDYPDVQAIEKFLTAHPDEITFTRIGEEVADIEERGVCYDRGVEIVRTINIPLGTEVDLDVVLEPLSVKLIKDMKEDK